MFEIEKLLSKEFFPVELPPCFTTEEMVAKLKKVIKSVPSSAKWPAVAFCYYGYKSKNSRRKFSIPNVCQYIAACKLIEDNAETIYKCFDNNISLTAPINTKIERVPYSRQIHSFNQRKKFLDDFGALYLNIPLPTPSPVRREEITIPL